jgi:hypothetical protein
VKKIFMLVPLLWIASTIPTYAEVRWIGEAEGKKLFGAWIKDVTGPPGRGYWAGEVSEVEIDQTEAGLTLTGRIKVRITWVTDRTSYRCHEIYFLNANEVEDFTHRSLMLTECS